MEATDGKETKINIFMRRLIARAAFLTQQQYLEFLAKIEELEGEAQ